MNEQESFESGVARLMAANPGYRGEAYSLIVEALGYALEQLHAQRHLSAEELVSALLAYSRQQFGPLAPTVLADFGVRGAADVGKLVYQMIGAGMLAASPEDSPEDFELVRQWFPPDVEILQSGALPPVPKID